MTNQDKKRNLNNKAAIQNLKNLILDSLEGDKAEDITLIDLEGKADFAHYMVIASGRSTKHVSSIAEKLLGNLKKEGHREVSVEGMKEANWVLIDALDIVIHLFIPEVRENYSLESMWNFTLPSRKEGNQ